MYFDNFKEFPEASLNPKLLWEYHLTDFDYLGMRNLVVQRVIERGWPNDWYFILHQYGVDGVKSAIKNLAYLNEKDMNFVSHQFNIPLASMKCYKKKPLVNQRWNS
jgi:hypothetical protein